MEYRTLPHGGEKISVIGLGSGSFSGTEQEMADVISAAIDNGINYFDMATSKKPRFSPLQRRLRAKDAGNKHLLFSKIK